MLALKNLDENALTLPWILKEHVPFEPHSLDIAVEPDVKQGNCEKIT
jgi:hypothetical protein